MTRARWRVALASGGVALIGYLLTLAAGVTFWDSGELIAAAHGLGIPHPPGAPLFVLLAHVWAAVVPVGAYAWRVNALTALAGAIGIACFALAVHEALRRDAALGDGVMAEIGAVLAATVAAFGFTAWQNANAAELYAPALALAGLVVWLAYLWRERRGTDRASRLLLLSIFVMALAVGNHLLTLLAGPAVLAFFVVTLRSAPATDPAARAGEWAEIGVVAGAWAFLVGAGLGEGWPFGVGVALFVASLALALRRRRVAFAAAATLVGALGLSTYLVLLIRAGQHPFINEAIPDTWGRLLDVIARTQYPARTPFDDPTVAHGAMNPGRSLGMVGMQLANYAQYFTWQWGIGLTGLARAVTATAFASLGFFGARAQCKSDRAGFWLFVTLWLVTGLGLVAYMNFKPGFTLFHDRFPDPSDHEVRERDYFFVLSFIAWGCWAGMQLARLGSGWWSRGGRWRGATGVAALVALMPLGFNWSAATRRGPDREFARDAAYDLLNSVGPYGILATGGDNDTFPLWYLQEVEGVRRDVTVVCLSLANTAWYMRQLSTARPGPFDPAAAPPIWRDSAGVRPAGPILAMSDSEIARVAGRLLPVERADTLALGPITHVLPAGITLYPSDYVMLRLIQQNLGKRPIVWAATAGRPFLGLDPYVVLRGLGWVLEPERPDPAASRFDGGRLGGALVDVPFTERLVWGTYRYGDLLTAGTEDLDPAARGMAINLSLPMTYLAAAAQRRKDLPAAVRELKAVDRLASTPALREILGQLEREMKEH